MSTVALSNMFCKNVCVKNKIFCVYFFYNVSKLANWLVIMLVDSGPVYTEHQHQYCDVASDITLIKLLRFLNKSKMSRFKNGL